jgi:deoxycytidine triphosphate deaminase
MSILSDRSLSDAIAKGQLIVGGVASNVKHCAYHFTAEKIFSPGERGEIHDWSTQSADLHYVIKPGALVWIRTQGIVKMPPNLCAFYWQTNTLSRNGLMLVNSSMVEPGYDGPLACLFANFGKQAITINPETVVAKLIFIQLDAESGVPLHLERGSVEYDRSLKQVAVAAPESFLQVSDLTKSLARERDEAIAEIKKAAEAARQHEVREFEKDFQGKLKGILWRSVAGVAVVILILNLSALAQSTLRPNIEREIQNRVEIELRRRTAAEEGATLARRDSLLQRIQAQNARIDSVKRRIDSLPQ